MTPEIVYQILLAICLTESNGDPKAFNYGDGKGFKNHSIGFCQINYITAVELGMPKQKSCELDLRNINKRTIHNCQLFDLNINLKYSYLYLKKQLKRYDNDIKKSISAYNAGSQSSKNKSYVKKVLRRLREKGSDKPSFVTDLDSVYGLGVYSLYPSY